jgi:hypothetical protein
MEHYYVYCPDCHITYSFTGYKTGFGKSKEQLSDMWESVHVCRCCKGMHLIDAEGDNDYMAHFPINYRKEDSTSINKMHCLKCNNVYLSFDTKEMRCPKGCGGTSVSYDSVDLTTDPINPHKETSIDD